MLNKKQHLNQYVINIQAVNNVDFKYVEFFLKPIWIQYIMPMLHENSTMKLDYIECAIGITSQ